MPDNPALYLGFATLYTSLRRSTNPGQDMFTLSLTIVNIDADTSHVESLTIADASDVRTIIASRSGHLAEGPTFTIDDDDAVTYHATIAI